MSRVRPHPLFDIWTADEAAECLEGLPNVVQDFLWNNIVPLQPSKYDQFGEPRYEEPVPGLNSLRKFWSKLPQEYQRQLNKAAERQERPWREFVEDINRD
jgi:hypothetical protein